ncbi:CaiB/BaiF CoA transferase family protein [Geobacter argillaceus]|uniref:Crotonobetainyl-CoA:carnitine CoA-transferase CaiB-like acyl-CoA transferase n=1 Tax=Geobacter argillaceus TaxID=345631 RepID=A0A562VKH3_9BACT|nr:CaiB/BaiF CoA-transferase family protein [Geobacter argillaceus]TWJ18355.1 crotonobetainyl-CoA:carnitine CoA-transferase CaiB-like acyl-CoA transferase [Geobacter argillaceus]
MDGPLKHVRVLDLSRVLAGPWAGQTLADLGAEVIKVERPGVGDDTRGWGPPFLADREGTPTRDAAYFLSANRGKKSVTIDFTRPEGQDLVRRLAASCDIVLENFKVGGLAQYGLDYPSLKEVNPGIIYCSITGFGQTGPYRQRAGYDFLIQGMGGLMSVTGEPGGEAGGPMKVGVAIVDIFTGMYATTAVLAALACRERTGIGQHVDLALLDVQVATLANQATNYLVSGRSPERLGNAHPNIVPYQAFATSDSHIILAVGNDEQYRRFCAVAGAPHLATDERFATNADRVRNRDSLIPLLRDIFGLRTKSWWIAELEKAGVPCGPINTIEEVFADPQVRARSMCVTVEHASAGEIPLVGTPMKFSQTPAGALQPPPLLGEHTVQVLEQLLGVDGNTITSLRETGVI